MRILRFPQGRLPNPTSIKLNFSQTKIPKKSNKFLIHTIKLIYVDRDKKIDEKLIFPLVFFSFFCFPYETHFFSIFFCFFIRLNEIFITLNFSSCLLPSKNNDEHRKWIWGCDDGKTFLSIFSFSFPQFFFSRLLFI